MKMEKKSKDIFRGKKRSMLPYLRVLFERREGLSRINF
jgi:hypothetical protein